MNAIFSEIIKAKNGDDIPILHNTHTIHSRYDPQKEAENFAKTISSSSFFLVIGIGGGYFIKAIRNRFPKSIILAVEHSDEDIIFLSQIITFKQIMCDDRIFIFPIYKTCEMLKKLYLPAIYGDISIIEYKSWAKENYNDILLFRKLVNEATKEISLDFSTQAHFGKIWQKNILSNLSCIENNNTFSFPLEKTALVVAAGPSLDEKVSFINKNRKNFFIIATDTSYQALSKYNIFCDAVVSIDGQQISSLHFIGNITSNDTIFVFDLCANSSIVHHIKSQGNKIIFIQTGHPLSKTLDSFCTKKIQTLYAGAGTVTIAATDFAMQCGFQKIIIAGADFSYNNKPYMKGSYFDASSTINSSKIMPIETFFTKLMFRTKLIKSDNKKYETEILNAYKKTFESWLYNNFFKIEQKNNFYICSEVKSEHKNILDLSNFKFDRKSFFTSLLNKLNSINIDSLSPRNFPQELFAILPRIAYQTKKIEKYSLDDFIHNIKLAYSEILRYNY